MALGSGGIALSWETLAPHGSQIPCLLFHPWNFGCRKPAWLWISLAPAFLNLKSPKVLQGQVLAAVKGVGLTRRRRSPLEASHIPSPPQCPGLSSACNTLKWWGGAFTTETQSEALYLSISYICPKREMKMSLRQSKCAHLTANRQGSHPLPQDTSPCFAFAQDGQWIGMF